MLTFEWIDELHCTQEDLNIIHDCSYNSLMTQGLKGLGMVEEICVTQITGI